MFLFQDILSWANTFAGCTDSFTDLSVPFLVLN